MDIAQWFIGAVTAILAIIGGVVSVIQLRIWLKNWLGNRVDGIAAVERDGLKILADIEQQGFKPDFVLGLGRSGAFLGGWLAGNLGSIPIEVIDRVHTSESDSYVIFPMGEKKLDLLMEIYGNSAKILIVEGATTWGGTFHDFEILRKKYAPDWICKFAVLYEVDTCKFPISFHGRILDRAPIRYPWHKTAKYKTAIRTKRQG